MSYQTLEIELDAGRVRATGGETLPSKARGLLTILNSASASPAPSSRTFGEAMRELGVQGRGGLADLSTNKAHLDDLGR
jgi:hypothetical protein